MRAALIGARAAAVADLVDQTVLVSSILQLAELLPFARVEPRLDAEVLVLVSGTPARDLSLLRHLVLPPVLVLARACDAAEVLAALRAGARSVLVEGQYTRVDLIEAISATAAGQSRLSASALTEVVRQISRPAEAAPTSPLSKREREIMDLIVTGASNHDIARHLGLAEKTVRNQVSRLYSKLGARNRAQATVRWLGRLS